MRVRYAGEEDAWSVVVVSLADSGREIAAVGNLAGVQPGENLRLTGRWTVHPKFGEQLRVESFTAVAPATLAGIERYLGSGLVTGIGKELASRLVRKFGRQTLEVIDRKPERLREVEGIGPVRSAQILEAWRTQRDIRDIMVFLQSYSVSTALANKIFKHYGKAAREVMRKDPYRLAADIPGVGFVTADAIAKNLGMPPSAPNRVEAGIKYALERHAEEGDTWAPLDALVEATAKLLSIESEFCQKAIDALAAQREIAIGKAPDAGVVAGLQRLARAEEETASLLARLATAPFPSSITNVDAEIARYQQKTGITLSPLQREAVARASRDKILVITGGPGTGKTTLVTAILRVFEGRGARVSLCAPTGRAAKRMSEATGRDALTIHRLLEFSPQKAVFLRDERNPLRCDALVVDETSMVDIELFHKLLKAVPLPAALVLVGDADQLPSVGPGSVLADLISSGAVHVVRLTAIFRQAEASAIVVNAHRINQGLMPLAAAPEAGDFFFVERAEPAGILETIRGLVATRIPRRFQLDSKEDVQVLTPMRKGELGVGNLNRELQALLNPAGPSLSVGNTVFRRGDRVMQTSNDYERGVFNGDVGRVADVDESGRTVEVSFDGRAVRYEYPDLDELSLAYACSIHKSQGSEFPAVVIALHTQHYVLLRRNLLYTAVTRGKRLVVIVGSRRALAIAVKSAGARERCTMLSQRLRHAFAPKETGPKIPHGSATRA